MDFIILGYFMVILRIGLRLIVNWFSLVFFDRMIECTYNVVIAFNLLDIDSIWGKFVFVR